MNLLNPATGLTLGGLTFALGILIWRIVRWVRKDKKDFKKAVPYLLALSVGMLGVLCAGGLLGLAFGSVARAMNMGGDALLSGATGAQTPLINGGAGPGAITPYGAMVLLLLLIGLIGAWASLTKTVVVDLVLGTLTGIGLGLSAGGAGLAANTLVPLVNGAGAALAGAFN
ncbi:hypothetical protein OG749_47185 (plasmid) [Streptomyces nojiriensis]|uniref:hypothetical protein n=1 Tax=Streptomyces nojiriensis TaxID=66374 RepID=UPI002E1781B1